MSVSTEQMLKAILDYSPENIVLMDRDHKVICYNERIRQTLYNFHGRYLEVGCDYRDFVVEMAMPTYLDAFAKALNGEITEVELHTIAENYRHWFHYRVNPVYTPDGILIGVSLSAENISERKTAQQELAESEGKFRALVEQSLVGVFILHEWRFIYVNPAFEDMIAITTADLIKSYTFNDFIHDDDLERLTDSCRDVIAGTQEKCHLIVSAVRADGIVRSLEIKISLIRYNGNSALLGSALDITERIDEEIRINEAVDRGQELERSQIGMELHDNVKQQLVVTALNLQLFMETLPEKQLEHPLLQKTIGYLQQAINDVRQLSHRIAPAIDEDTGILVKVKDLVEGMNVKSNLHVSLEIEDSFGNTNPEMQRVVYRIIQEQFSNIIKYAHASAVQIKVQKNAGHLVVAITDNGVGTNLSEKISGIGLHNIRRRVQVLGGSVQIQTSPGNGFYLTAYIPL
ncbi:MAG: PAS domain S-box protein [Chitinophagaceae bacterium]|nr:MAG: PAS domain S-box protein [Chitinophagaceae bacterium]